MSVDTIQSQLKWEEVTPSEFENLVFFLLDDMGFKNLEWRKGGEGISATDGGRDLEATYTNIEPGDIVTLEKWWVEVKYRSRNLSPASVKESILNATGREGVDVFAIVTTATISNKTWDWVKEFQSSHPRLRIRIWQRHDLERILRKYPQTVARFLPACMTLADRLEAVENRFWNSVALPTLDEIESFWRDFSNLEWNGSRFLPLIVAEASSGYPEFRQWGLVADEELLLETLVVGLANAPQLVARLGQYGQPSNCLVAGLAYLLQTSLLRLELKGLLSVITNPYRVMEGNIAPPPELLSFIWKPVLSQMCLDLGTNCSQDCDKVDWGGNSRHLTASYFDRFVKWEQVEHLSREEPFVIIQLSEFACTLGIVPEGEFCSLSEDVPDNCGDIATLKESLEFAQKVIQARANRIVASRKSKAG